MTPAGRTAQQMYPLVESYLQGQHTQQAFCAQHGLSTSVLNYWLAKYRRERTPETAHHRGAFMEITPGNAPAEKVLFEVVYPHGVRLRLFEPVEPTCLERLLGLGER